MCSTAVSQLTFQVIQIGDHLQLRPSVETYELEVKHGLAISMMERLISLNLPHVTLLKQNRMHPEISALLLSIYPHLQDREGVSDRAHPNQYGMAQRVYFWDHRDPDSIERSCSNKGEQDRIVALVDFLVSRGCEPKKITVLAAYQRQASNLKIALAHHQPKTPAAAGLGAENKPMVYTIDMFQGDENDIVIVSLVRQKKMGFLSMPNRLCVAQSRSRCALYFVGNAELLCRDPSSCWRPIITALYHQPALGEAFPVCCTAQAHRDQIVPVDSSEQLGAMASQSEPVCQKTCSKRYALCPHSCPLKCHDGRPCKPCSATVSKQCRKDPTHPAYPGTCGNNEEACPSDVLVICSKNASHQAMFKCCDKVRRCTSRCLRSLPCSHSCSRQCWQDCNSPKSCEVCRAEELKRQQELEAQREIARAAAQLQLDKEIAAVRARPKTKMSLVALDQTTHEFIFVAEQARSFGNAQSHAGVFMAERVFEIVDNNAHLQWLQVRKKLHAPNADTMKLFLPASDKMAQAFASGRDIAKGNVGFKSSFEFSEPAKSSCHLFSPSLESTDTPAYLVLCEVAVGEVAVVPLPITMATSPQIIQELFVGGELQLKAKRSTPGPKVDSLLFVSSPTTATASGSPTTATASGSSDHPFGAGASDSTDNPVAGPDTLRYLLFLLTAF